MPTPEQIAAYQQIKSDGTLDNISPEKAAKYRSIYEPIINPVSKTETALRMGHQGLTGGLQDELAGIGSVIGNSMSKTSALTSLFSPTLGIASIANDLITDLAKGDQTSESMLNTYRQGRDKAREVNQYAEASNPKTGIISNVVGSLPLAFISPASAETTLGRLGTSALVGGAYGGGVSNADLTKGDVGGFAKDVGLGAGLGVGADLLFMGLGAGAVGASKTQIGRKILTAADEAFPSVGGVVKKLIPSISESGRQNITANKLKKLYATQTIDDFVKANGGKVDDVMAQKASAQGFPVQDAESLQSTLMASKASKEAGQKGILRSAVQPPLATVESIPSTIEPAVTQKSVTPKLTQFPLEVAPEQYGNQVKIMRDSLGMNRVSLAERTGIPAVRLRAIEENNGVNKISKEEFENVVNVVNDVHSARNSSRKAINPDLFPEVATIIQPKVGIVPERALQIEAANKIGEATGFTPAIEPVKTPSILNTPETQNLIQQEAKNIADTSGTGVPNMANVKIPEPTELGGAPTVNKAGNFNLDNFPTTEEGQLGAIQQGFQLNHDLMMEGRDLGSGTMTREQALQLAKERGITQESLMQRPKGKALNGPEVAFAKEQQKKLAQDLWMDLKTSDTSTPENKLKFAKKFMQNFAFDATTQGGLSESARGMALAKQVTSLEDLQRKASKTMFKVFRDGKNLDLILDAYKNLDYDNPKELVQFIKNLKKTNWEKANDIFFSVVIGGDLSGPKTIERNILGNLQSTLISPVKKVIAGLADIPLTKIYKTSELRQLQQAYVDSLPKGTSYSKDGFEKFYKKNAKVVRDRFVTEALPNIVGYKSAIGSASKGFWNSLKGIPDEIPGVQKYSDALNVVNPIPGVWGKINNYAATINKAADVFQKTINYGGETEALLVRQATKEGAKDIPKRVAELRADMPRWIHEAGKLKALDDSYQSQLTASEKRLVNALSNFRVFGITPFKMISPYLPIGLNLTKYSLRHSPVGAVRLLKLGYTKGQVADILGEAAIGTATLVGGGGGIPVLKKIYNRNIQERPYSQIDAKSMNLARSLTAGIAGMYEDGTIWGNTPTDPAKRGMSYLAGRSPYGVRVGDKAISLQGLDPASGTLAFMLDGMEAWNGLSQNDAADAQAYSLLKASQGFMNRIFMRSMSDLMKVWSDSDRYGENYIKGQAGRVVPLHGLLNSIGNAVDPYLRQPETATDVMKSTLNPWYRKTMPFYYDKLGEPVRMEGGAISRFLNPVKINTIPNDKLIKELDRLNINPPSVDKSFGSGLEYNSPVYYLAQRIRGNELRRMGHVIVDQEGYSSMNEYQKEMALKNAVEESHKSMMYQIGTAVTLPLIKDAMLGLSAATKSGDIQSQKNAMEAINQLLDRKVNVGTPEKPQMESEYKLKGKPENLFRKRVIQ